MPLVSQRSLRAMGMPWRGPRDLSIGEFTVGVFGLLEGEVGGGG